MSLPALKGSPLPPAKKPAGLAGQLEANKKPILIAGAGLVTVFALLHRKQAAAGADPAGAAGTPAGFAGQSTSSGPYDSTGTDVYNALQPQIEQTQGMLANLLARLGPSGTIPTPSTPAPVSRPTPATPTPRIPTPAPPVKHAPPPKRGIPIPGPVKKPATTSYVVRKGDNLSVIGKKFGTSWQNIYASNRGVIGSNPNLIRPGQKLILPAKK